MTEEAQQVLSPETVKVGDGVTFGVGSDRVACTVTSVSKTGKTIGFTTDDYKMAEGGSYYGHQVYEYTSVEAFSQVDPMGGTQTNESQARWNAKKGRFVYFGRALMAGRHGYRDPSF